MNCISCGNRNPATVTYCQKCGKKLDLTADEIRDSLVQKAQEETAQNTEFYARRLLVLSIVLFVLAMTGFVATGGAPEETDFIPSASRGARYVRFEYLHLIPLEPLAVPFKE